MSDWCKYFDCGWCYHPETNYENGCIGLSDCDIRETDIIVTDKDAEDDD